MKTEIKDITQSVKELTITIEAEQALSDYKKVLNQFRNYVVIPGFRKGKAPLAMIERNYQEHAKDEFYNKKLGDYYKAALDELKINPVNQGEATKIEWDKGQDLVAIFKYEVMPEIVIKKYKNLEIPFEKTKFKPKMIDDTIEDFRNQMATVIDADSPSKKGDIIEAEINFLDENGDITKDIKRTFTLGENVYSNTFNKNLTNIKVGDEIKTKLFTKSQKTDDKDITENIKDREFLIKVLSIKRKILPELNDEFAKDIEYDSVEDLRTKIAEEIKKKIKKENTEMLRNAIIEKLVEENPLEIPPSMIRNYAESMAKNYAESYKMDIDKVIPIYEKIAEHQMKSHYILTEIKKIEKVEITDEDKEKIIKEAAENLKMETGKYKELYKKQIESEDFKYAAEEKKMFELIEKSSKFVPYPKKELDADKRR